VSNELIIRGAAVLVAIILVFVIIKRRRSKQAK